MVDITVSIDGKTLMIGTVTEVPRRGELMHFVNRSADITLRVKEVIWLLTDGVREHSQATLELETMGLTTVRPA